ncbi:MAG: LysM peptidoglycan-binding domain-containing protein, partial [Caldilineae bacterium]
MMMLRSLIRLDQTSPKTKAFGVRLVLALLLLGSMGTAPGVWAQPAAQDDGEQVHVVRFGETLSEIAQSYGVSMAALMAQNDIQDPERILVGQRLVVPTSSAAVAGAAAVAEIEPVLPAWVSVASLNRTHQVGPGDTLGWIALRYGVDVDALRALNGLEPDEPIHIGQILLLPATEEELQVTTPPRTYTVQPGDSLGFIAQRFQVSLQALMAVNRIGDPDRILPG